MLNASIVLYHPNWQQVLAVTEVLLGSRHVRRVYWIDNSPLAAEHLPLENARVEYRFNGKNLGYGAAHNIALRESIKQGVKYHLVVNSDVVLDVPALDTMIAYMDKTEQVGSLMPKVMYPNGELQHLCKLLPTPIDMITRRLLPQSWFAMRNARYEMHASGYDKQMNVPYLSGCFMLLRTQAAAEVGLFDERYFMYPEDMDLTRRIHRRYQTIYYPEVSIVHEHSKASYKSLKMFGIHAINMCRYFNKWGWFVDAERERFNRAAIQDYLSCK
jgi:GT2 family glycosyltransferase